MVSLSTVVRHIGGVHACWCFDKSAMPASFRIYCNSEHLQQEQDPDTALQAAAVTCMRMPTRKKSPDALVRHRLHTLLDGLRNGLWILQAGGTKAEASIASDKNRIYYERQSM